jgi:hypothetical protein
MSAPSPELPQPLAGVVSRYRGPVQKPERRKPGRPLKRSEDYFRALLDAHREAVAWFLADRGCEPQSDCQLYTAYFARVFEANGERAGRASSTEFQGSLKTLRNELAEARRIERANPVNAVISRTSTAVK